MDKLNMLRIIFIGILGCGHLFSTEIDSFNLRDTSMQDALAPMNAVAQNYFDEALKKANRRESCDPEVFEDIFHDLTGGVFWADIERQIERSDKIDRRNIHRSKSVYQDITIVDGLALYLARLGFVMRFGDFYVGSDKFGHFFDQGYDYFQKKNLDEAMSFGEMTERTYYGLTSTAVYSYGDLAANLDGYFFWQSLTRGKNAYVTCEEDTWSQVREFSWTDYANAAWDEGLNCSTYRNEYTTSRVLGRIKQLGMSCPVEPQWCDVMLNRYGYLAPRVISPACYYP